MAEKKDSHHEKEHHEQKASHKKDETIVEHLEKEEKILDDIKTLLKKDLEAKSGEETVHTKQVTETIEVDQRPSANEKSIMDESDGEEGESSHLFRNIFIIIIGIILVIGLVMFLKQKQMQDAGITEEKSVTPTVVENTITPTEEPLDKAKYTITIQNGSGVTGEAGRAKTALESEDFVVDNTANADTTDYMQTIIRARSSVPTAFTDALKEALAETYAVEETVQVLKDANTSDVIVVLGSEKK